VILQHENARPHTANMTKAASGTRLGLEIIPHPPYSPDLAPSDYRLFRYLQQSARRFLQQRYWVPKLARRLHGQTGGFLQAWDRKPTRTLGGSSE
jgi:hypothetical protein